MILAINRKNLGNFRNGVKDGAGTAWKQARRVEFRMPWTYRKPLKSTLFSKPWVLGLTLVSSALAIAGGILYFRKRRQVADRYNMGEAEGSWEGSRAPGSESLSAAGY